MRFPIQITSDGTAAGTSIIDADGKPVGKVTDVAWKRTLHHGSNGLSRCMIFMEAPELDDMIDAADDQWHVDRMGAPVLAGETG